MVGRNSHLYVAGTCLRWSTRAIGPCSLSLLYLAIDRFCYRWGLSWVTIFGSILSVVQSKAVVRGMSCDHRGVSLIIDLLVRGNPLYICDRNLISPLSILPLYVQNDGVFLLWRRMC